jgi:GT2 family glycosyltransferase/SAM-dependent methyltransferase
MSRQTAIDSHTSQAAAPPARRTLRDYRDLHLNDTIVVCGCGVSLSELTRPEDFVTIGVNDVGRLFQPNYLVVLNPRSQFSGDRFNYVEQSHASALFTQLNLGGHPHPNIVRFRLGRRGGVDVSDPDSLPYTRNSPYVALCLALYMGAKRIGLIGVDFTRDHFFAKTGIHSLMRDVPAIDAEFKRLYDACAARKIEIFNLSEVSRLTALPKMSIDEFSRRPANRRSLNIVSYSVTPVAGVPVILSQCIAARTLHTCRTVWATHSYGNGVQFDSDVEWTRAPAQAEELLRAADLFIIHNGKVDPRHKSLLAAKPIITMAHNYMWNVDSTYFNQGMPGVVVGQYQATLPEFSRWHVAPNPLPTRDGNYQPGAKNREITICYTPSGKHEKYAPSHRLYWHSKGYATTMRVLNALARRHSIRLETIAGAQVSHAQSLAMKQRSHIVIDECVTGSYHRNSLEGLAVGAVVINGLGILPAVHDVFSLCSGTDEVPFVHATLETLEEVLEKLIQQGREALAELGARNRAWFELHWDFEQQWNRFWEPVVDEALYASRRIGVLANGHRALPEPPPQIATGDAKSGRISAVMCTGGRDRLSQLRTCLASLRQHSEIGEILLVDMGAEPFAAEIARRWAHQYFFVRNDGIFERARCLNIGAALAACELILWLDGDLLLPPGFLTHAIAELERRNLDFLVPFSQVNHLSASDSESIHTGTRSHVDCRAESVRRNAYGGAGLVRSSFVRAHGGFPEGFRGWGGEDDAWWHKARVLGNAAATGQRGQIIYHLHHPHAGDFERNRQRNPHHADNVALLREVWSATNRDQFLGRFPPPAQPPWNWQDKRILVLGSQDSNELTAASVSDELARLTGIRTEAKTLSLHDPLRETADLDGFDAILILEPGLAATLLADDAMRTAGNKFLVLQPGHAKLTEIVLERALAVVCMQTPVAQLTATGPAIWTAGRKLDPSSPAWQIARACLQPLSLLLGGASLEPARRGPLPTVHPATFPSTPTLPVWMYWEGDYPEWIARCQKTALRAAADVRILSQADFQRVRNADLDIELQALHVAQRADFIRAYLLAKFGGLWLDSDCLVMQPLDRLLSALRHYDFIAHRERTANLWANDLMAAAPDSKIAARLYANICSTLRSRKKIGWTDLGCLAVTQAIDANLAPWLELKVERVQPVCWSQSTSFLEIKTEAEHEKHFDRDAICYMLSNLTMQKSLHEADLSSRLLRDGTFFRFLLNRAATARASASNLDTSESPATLGVSQPATSVFSRIHSEARKMKPESVSGPGSTLKQTAEIRQRLPILFESLGVRFMLDAGCGDCNWMQTLELALERYIGVDLISELVEQGRPMPAASARFVGMDIARDPLPRVDLILCRDVLVLLSFDDIARAIRNFKRSGARYLLATTFSRRVSNTDAAGGVWRPLNLQAEPFNLPPPLRVIDEKCGENGNEFSDKCLALWKLEDIFNSLPAVAETHAETTEALPAKIEEEVTDPVDTYELSVVIPISIARGQRERLRNLEACLRALNSQDLERSRYCLVVVEQDSEPRVEQLCKELADRYIFAYNANVFNKSWGFNVGAAAVEPNHALCLMDADMLPAPSFLRLGLERILSGHRAVRPYAKVTYLDALSTQEAIRARDSAVGECFSPDRFNGLSFPHAKGGCLFVDPRLFTQLGGFDERFRGFGYEDTEFWNRIARRTSIDRLPGTLLHMHHARTVHNGGGNGHLFRQISSGRASLWSGPMGGVEKYAGERNAGAAHTAPRGRQTALNVNHRNHGARTMIQAFTEMRRYCEDAGMESLSGPGSSLDQTAEIRAQLPDLLRDLGVTSLLDCGCGDFHWMQRVDLSGVQYTGVELLSDLSAAIQARFKSAQRNFLSANIVSDALPKADLILCRDSLVHFPLELVMSAFRNFKASGATYLLITHFSRPSENRDIALGDWRPLNFRLVPFGFPEPTRLIEEKCTENQGSYSDKCLALWRISDLEI